MSPVELEGQVVGGLPFTSPRSAAGSFEEFYAAHRESVARTLALSLNDHALGFEAADEAMVRAYRKWPEVSRFNNPEGWVFRVGLNWGRSWFRQRFTAAAKAPMLANPGPLPSIEDLATDSDVAAAIAGLNHHHRVVVVLRFERDYTIPQIAEVLEVAEGTVKSRLSRALDLLRVDLVEGGYR